MQAGPRVLLLAPANAPTEFLLRDLSVQNHSDTNDILEEGSKRWNTRSKSEKVRQCIGTHHSPKVQSPLMLAIPSTARCRSFHRDLIMPIFRWFGKLPAKQQTPILKAVGFANPHSPPQLRSSGRRSGTARATRRSSAAFALPLAPLRFTRVHRYLFLSRCRASERQKQPTRRKRGLKMLFKEASRTKNNQELVKASIDALIKALEAGQSDALFAYLTAMSQFHNYSFQNILLIAEQRPMATRVAGIRFMERIRTKSETRGKA
jgi:hypothetical protein